MIVESKPYSQMSAAEISQIMKRICEHLHIAFSANRVLPCLADLDVENRSSSRIDQFDAIGKQFGIRLRPMTGSMSELANVINDLGPALIKLQDDDDSMVLVLDIKSRGRMLIYRNGHDQTVTTSWLKRRLKKNSERLYRWHLIQPLFAARNASRLQYDTSSPIQKLSPLRRLVGLLKPEADDIRTIIIFSVVIGLLSLTTPLAVEAVVNTIAFGRYLQPLIVLSFIVFVFLSFLGGLNILMTIVTEVIQRKLFVRTVEDLSYRLTRVPLSTWQKYHGPELVNRFFDIVNVQKITSKLMLDTLMLGLQTIVGLTVLAFYHPFLLGYDVALLTMMGVILYFIGRGAIPTAIAESQMKYETAAWLQEIVRHPTTFKYNGGLGYAINRADEFAAKYIGFRQQHFRILIRQVSFAMVMQAVAATVLLALGGYLVIDGQMNLGQLVAAELIVAVILSSFAKLGKDLESFYDLMASVDKLGKLFDLPVERMDKLQLARRPGAYELNLVNVKLDAQLTLPESMTIERGKTYALFGSSELLRAKLMEVLVGQQKPVEGHVLLDEYRVDSIAAESLQEKISFVREIELFEGSVDDNLRMGRHSVGSSEVSSMVEKLGLRQVLAGLSDGYSTTVKICGYPLSQGQAIRLVLARALIAKPGILFIDGLLDRLSDTDTRDVLERLNEFGDTTTIVVSTGREAVANWANTCLDIENKVCKVHTRDEKL